MNDLDTIRQAWRNYDAALPDRAGWRNAEVDAVESYPAGNGEAELAHALLDEGVIYAINTLILHPLGYSLGVDTHTPHSIFITRGRCHGHEGYAFEEADHEHGLGRIRDTVLGALLTRLREVEPRLAAELQQRTANGAFLTREQIDERVTAAITDEPSTIDTLTDELSLTRAQVASSLLRINATRADSGHYSIIE